MYVCVRAHAWAEHQVTGIRHSIKEIVTSPKNFFLLVTGWEMDRVVSATYYAEGGVL